MDQMIEPILALEERLRIVIDPRTSIVIGLHGVIERLYVATRTERSIAAASQIDRRDCFVCRPCPHLRVYDIDHLQRQRVQRLRRVQRNYAYPIFGRRGPLRQDRCGRSIVQQMFGDHRALLQICSGRTPGKVDGFRRHGAWPSALIVLKVRLRLP